MAAFGGRAILISFVVAVPVLSLVGILATDHGGPVFHREPVKIHEYPWPAIGKVASASFSSGQLCTGAVIGSNQFLTAAHCLYNKRTHRVATTDSINVLLGYEKGKYRLHMVASRVTMPAAFDPSVYSYSRDPIRYRNVAGRDWAIIHTKQPFPPEIRPLRVASAIPSLGAQVKFGGYPIERPHMMTADLHCQVKSVSPDGRLIGHDCVVHHGDSGGPLLSGKGDDEGLIFGVQILGHSLFVELQEQSKEGGWAVSTASILEFLGPQVLGSLGDQETKKISTR
jgi:protease YdgD